MTKEDILRRLYWVAENMPEDGYYVEVHKYGLADLSMSKQMFKNNIKLFLAEGYNGTYVMASANSIYSQMNMPYIEDMRIYNRSIYATTRRSNTGTV